MKKKIYLNSLEKAHDFVIAMSKLHGAVDVKRGHCFVNGKSILGMLSLDLSKAMDVEFKSSNKAEVTYFNNLILPFEVYE